jgi:hypothetical protein
VTERSPHRSGLHIAVAQARAVAISGGIYGFSLTIFAVTVQKLAWAIVLAVLPPLAVVSLTRRLNKGARVWGPEPPIWARAPVYAAAVAFVAYAVALSVIHVAYFGTNVDAFGRETHTEELKVKAHDAPIEAHERVTTTRLRLVLKRDRLRATRMKQLHLDIRQLSRTRQPTGSLVQELTSLESRELAELKALGPILTHENKLQRKFEYLRAGRGPSASELPAWFGRLRGFFTVASQILAALVIALALTRSFESVTRKILQAAMPLAVFGIVAGVIGNLPSLSRSTQAILLGPVFAGLAGGLAALVVIALDLLDEGPEGQQLSLLDDDGG